MMYTLKRFCIEFLRADSPRLIGSLTIFHLLSVAVFVFAAIQLSIIGARRR
jgi:prolipoprotein diacylglyceryltransferase